MSSGGPRTDGEGPPPLGVAPSEGMEVPARRLSIGATGRGRSGSYRLIAPIARGGMGEVFLAETMLMSGERRQVIIKRLLEGLQSDTAHVQMFRSEAEHLALLDHKNIVRILDVPEINGARCLALEYVRGRSVAQILDRTRHLGRRVPADVAVYVISEVLEGLDHVHAARLVDGQPVELVHRDVTPGNLLVSFDGDVKITDFGISKSVMSKVATTVGIVKGKARYLAPEQILGERASGQSDIFSAACVIFEMLTGVPLFDRPSVPKTLTAIVHGEVPELRAVLPFPHATRLLELIASALSVHADKRPARARDLARELREAAARELGPPMSRGAVAAFIRQLFDGQDEPWELAAVPAEPHETGVGTPSSPALQMDRGDVERRAPPPLRAGSIADDDAISGIAAPPASPVSEPPPIRGQMESTLLVERARGRAAPTEVVVRVAAPGVVPQSPRDASVTPTFEGEEATQAVLPRSPLQSGPSVIERPGDDAATLSAFTLDKLAGSRLRAPDESDDSTEAYDGDEKAEPTQRGQAVTPDEATVQFKSERFVGTVPVAKRPVVSIPRPEPTPSAPPPRASKAPIIALVSVFVLGAGTGIAITAMLREAPTPIPPAQIVAPVAPVAPVAELPTPDPIVEVAPEEVEPEVAAASSAPTIDLLYPKDARVRIDGRLLEGKLPIRGVELEPGTRQITIQWKGKRKDLVLDAQPGVHATLGKEEYKRGSW